jgi:hypothetical protein
MELAELNLGSKVFLPDLVTKLNERYQFSSNNSTDKADLKEKGLLFEAGYSQAHSIKKLSFNPSLTYVEGEESTDISQQILIDLLEWAQKELGANFTPQSIQRWAFVSNIVFQSDFPLLFGQNNVLNSVAEKVAHAVQENLREKLDFQPAHLSLGHDPQKRSTTIAPFSIQHRANTLFEDNIFFAEAPIPTSLHLELLEEIETEFRKGYESR